MKNRFSVIAMLVGFILIITILHPVYGNSSVDRVPASYPRVSDLMGNSIDIVNLS